MSEQTRILIVEDMRADFELAQFEIHRSVHECIFEQVETRQGFLEALKTFRPDVILSDYSLPHFDGMTALKLAKDQSPLTPFIVWTGSLSEDVVVECLKAGANNYILKENIKRLGPAVVHAIEERRLLVERKQTEDALVESEARYHGIFESVQDAIFVESLEGNILEVNQRACEIFGYTREEFITKKVTDLVPSPDYIVEFNDENMSKGQIVETVNVRANGKRFPVEIRGGLYEFGGQKLFLITLRDISELKRAKENYQDIFENAREGIFQSTPEGRYIHVNRAMARIYGYDSPGEMMETITSITDQIYLSPEDRRDFTLRLQSEEHIENFEMKNLRKDRTIIWTSTSARAVRDSGNTILYYEGFLQDITERKQAEEKLRVQENRFRALIENSLDNISLLAADGTLLWENPAVNRMLGYEQDEFVNRNIFELMHPDDLGWVNELFSQLVHEPGAQRRNIFRLKSHSGRWLWVEAVATNLLHDVNVKAIVINYRDITERKQSEEQLRNSEARFVTIFENSPVGIGISRLSDGKIIHANTALANFYEYSREEMIGHTTAELGIWANPGDRQRFMERLQAEKHIRNFEAVARLKSGKERHVIVWGEMVDVNGEPCMMAQTLDITERKQAEIALLNARELFQKTFHLSPVATVLSRIQDRSIVDINTAAEGLFGYTRSEMMENPTMDFHYWVDDEERQRVFKLLLQQGRINNYEFSFRNKWGEVGRGILSAEIIEQQEEKYVLTTFVNITERKRAEIEIQKRNDDLQLINTINQAAMRGENLNEIVKLLAKELNLAFSSSGSTLYMLDPDGTSLTMQQYLLPSGIQRQIENLIGSTIPLIQIPIHEGGFFQKILISRRGCIMSEREEIQKWMEEFIETPFLPPAAKGMIRKLIPRIYDILNIRSTITIPLLLNGRSIGILDVSSTGLFTEEDLERIENISGQLTAVIQRQQAIEQVRHSEIFLHSVQNALSASLAILDQNGVIVQVNSAWRKFGEQNGLECPEYGIGLNYLDICDSASGENAGEAPLVARAIREVIAGQRREFQIEYPCHSPEEKRWFTLRVTKFKDGDHIWVVLAHENITERRQAEETIRETSEQFRVLFESSPEGIILIEPKDDWKILDCNDIACTMNGYTRDELIGQSIDVLTLVPGDAEARQEYLEIVRKAGTLRFDDFHRRKDGSIFPIAISTSLITLGGRDVILGIDRDITERKLAEEEIRKANEKYRNIFENAVESIHQTTPDGRYITANPATARTLGYASPEEMISAVTDLDRQFYVDPGRRAEFIRKMDEDDFVSGFESEVYRKDGSIIWISENVRCVRDEHGNLLYYEGTSQEITERKRAEQAEHDQRALAEALRNTSEILNSTLDYGEVLDHILSAVGSVVPHDAASIMLIENDSAHVVRVQGYAERYFDTEIAKIEFPLASTTNLKQMFETRQPVVIPDTLSYPGWKIIPATDWLRSNVGAPISISGEVVGFILLDSVTTGFFTPVHADRLEAFANQAALAIHNARLLQQAQEEIAERKRTESELRISEERFRQLADNIQEVFWMTDAITGEEVYISPAAEKIWGHSLEDLMTNSNAFIESIYPADLPAVQQILDIQRAGQPTSIEYRTLHPDGSICWVWDRAFPIFDDSGRVVRLAGIAADITERKQAEDALRESEVRFSGVINSAMDAIISVDSDLNVILFNPAAEKVFGYSARDVIGQSIDRFIPDRYRAQHREHNLRFGQAGNTSRDMAHLGALSGLRSNGTEFPIEASISHIEIGGQHLYTVILRDITERKRAEEQLRKLSRAVEQSASSIVITDTIGNIEYVNPKFTASTGYTIEEARGQNPRILKSGHTTHEEYVQLWKTITSGEEWHGEFMNIKKNGEPYWESVTISPIFNDRGEITNFIAVKEDITERKKNDVSTQRHFAELQALYENGLAVGRLLNPHDIGERIIETFARHLSWHHVTIRLIQGGSNNLALIALSLPGMKEEERAEIEQRFQSKISKVGEGLSGWVAKTGMPIRTGAVHSHPQYVDTHTGIQSGLYMPLKIGDQVLGVISVESEQIDAFTQQDERLLATLANQAAVAFENARLYQSIQLELRERSRAESLMQKRFEMMEYSADHGLEELMQKTLDEISEWTHSTMGFFQLIKEDERTPGLKVWSTETFEHVHSSSQEEEMYTTADQAAVWEEAIQKRRAVIHNDYTSMPGRMRLFEDHALLVRDLVVPIIRNEKIVAVIGIGNKIQEYTRDDLEITERFADYAWDIIERKQILITLADERNQLAKRVEERTSDLSRANSNLARALRVKDEFLANMSHELRTPLNAILGLSESLTEQTAGPLNEKQQRYLTTISESGHHLLSLINDILDLAKIEAGQITLDINKVNVNAVSQASLRMIKQQAQKKNLNVVLEIDPQLGLIWADERRLKQMMVNLLSNAVKFTPEDGKIGLQIVGHPDENKVAITVWDTGIGIKESDFERLFQPFMQLDAGLARESSGTGLGLALVSQMARLHGGSVALQSEAGKGSRFTIILPWEPALPPDTVDRMKVTGKFRAIRSGQVQETILLVEDTEEVVMTIKDYLEMAGYKVVTAQDGVDGITQARIAHPDLILMDVQMPRMDGLEATRRLRRDAEFQYTPIIALTALAMPNDRERCIAAGMDEYISKPVNLRGLVKLIQNCLSLQEEKTRPR